MAAKAEAGEDEAPSSCCPRAHYRPPDWEPGAGLTALNMRQPLRRNETNRKGCYKIYHLALQIDVCVCVFLLTSPGTFLLCGWLHSKCATIAPTSNLCMHPQRMQPHRDVASGFQEFKQAAASLFSRPFGLEPGSSGLCSTVKEQQEPVSGTKAAQQNAQQRATFSVPEFHTTWPAACPLGMLQFEPLDFGGPCQKPTGPHDLA